MAYLTGNTSLNTAEAQVAFGAVTISNAHRVVHRDVLLFLAGLEPASPPGEADESGPYPYSAGSGAS